MNEVVRTIEEIRADTTKLRLTRDTLLDWIIQHVGEDWECRVYAGKHWIMVGIDKPA